jgi:hypothetical protein
MVHGNFLLLTVLLTCAAFSTTPQEPARPPEQPDVIAIGFSWAKQNSGLIRGAQNPGGPITTPMPADTTDLGSRKTELRNVDNQATLSVDEQGNSYHILLEFKNTGPNVVRSLIWEFRPTAAPADYLPKQYLCALKVKPNEKKKLELWTAYAPVKVVNANIRLNGLKDGEVRINRIEYLNGPVWKRRDWRYSLPAGATDKMSEGKCSMFDS